MAIQFNCPYCTATIKVPDNAAGKKGTCPQCGTKVVVPVPKNAPPASQAVPQLSANAAPAAAPNFFPGAAPNGSPEAAPMPAQPPPMQWGGFPTAQGMPLGFDPNQPMTAPPGYAAPHGYAPPMGFAPGQPFVPAPVAPMPSEPAAAPRKSPKKRKQTLTPAMMGIIAVVVIAVGVVAYVFLKPGAKANPLSGTLTGTRLAKGKLQPALVHRDWLEGIDEETVTGVLKQMEKRTVTLRSDAVVLKFQGAADGIKVTATPGLHGELIAVDVTSHKALSKWQEKQGVKLSERHQKELIRAAKTLIQEWAKAEAAGEKKLDFSRFHDTLGIAALTSGLGAEAVAIVNRTPHRCVAEQQGLLYFLLPEGTDRFELQGRADSKGATAFAGHFVVEVETVAPKKSKKTEDETEMADEEDTEKKTKSFGRPALNDPAAMDESMPEKGMPAKPKAKKDE